MDKPLSRGQLNEIGSCLKDLSRVINDSSENYAYYRGRMYSKDDDKIYLVLLASKESGALIKVPLAWDYNTNRLHSDKKIQWVKGYPEKVTREIKRAIQKIMELPFNVGTINFDLAVPFDSGYMSPSGEETGCYDLYLFNDLIRDMSGGAMTGDE